MAKSFLCQIADWDCFIMEWISTATDCFLTQLSFEYYLELTTDAQSTSTTDAAKSSQTTTAKTDAPTAVLATAGINNSSSAESGTPVNVNGKCVFCM